MAQSVRIVVGIAAAAVALAITMLPVMALLPSSIIPLQMLGAGLFATEYYHLDTQNAPSFDLLLSESDIYMWSDPANLEQFNASECSVHGPGIGGTIALALGSHHVFNITTHNITASGQPSAPWLRRGAHFEVLIRSDSYRARPRTIDLGNGNYTIDVNVPPFHWLAGPMVLEVWLLSSGGGAVAADIQWSPSLVGEYSLLFVDTATNAAHAEALDVQCRSDVWSRPVWSGYWVRLSAAGPACNTRMCNATLPYVKREPSLFPCNKQGWVYRLHGCYFRLFSVRESRQCLNNEWLFFLGDSNFQDTTRNLGVNALQLNRTDFLLTLGDLRAVKRTFDAVIRDKRPGVPIEYRATQVFNGAFPDTRDYVGLKVYDDELYHQHVRSFWDHRVTPANHTYASPTIVVLNDASLHGAQWTWGGEGMRDYNTRFGSKLLPLMESLHSGSSNAVPTTGREPQRWLYRFTITPAGLRARKLPANPHKVELMNHLVAHRLLEHSMQDPRNIQWSFLDAYDITYPWHWDLTHSDGGHYGREGVSMVDDMVVHIYLDYMCGTGRSGSSAPLDAMTVEGRDR